MLSSHVVSYMKAKIDQPISKKNQAGITTNNRSNISKNKAKMQIKNVAFNSVEILNYYAKNNKDYIPLQQQIKTSIEDKKNKTEYKNELFNNSIENYQTIDGFLKSLLKSFAFFGIQLRIPIRNGSGFMMLKKRTNRVQIRFKKTKNNNDKKVLFGTIKNLSKCLYFLYHSKKLSTMAFKRAFIQYSIYCIHHKNDDNKIDTIENLKAMLIIDHNKLNTYQSEIRKLKTIVEQKEYITKNHLDGLFNPSISF